MSIPMLSNEAAIAFKEHQDAIRRSVMSHKGSCFCGAVGCLERIVSTKQLPRFGSKSGRSLDEVLGDAGNDRATIDQVLNHPRPPRG